MGENCFACDLVILSVIVINDPRHIENESPTNWALEPLLISAITILQFYFAMTDALAARGAGER